MKTLSAILVALCVAMSAPVFAEIADAPREAKVFFNAINKISGRTTPLEIPAGAFSSYDKLQIYPSKCVKLLKGDQTVYAALVEVYETSFSKTPIKLFSGWLFSDSRSLTNIENQYYDLILESCTLPEEEAEVPEAPMTETQTVPMAPAQQSSPETNQDQEDATPLD
ncbi:MAG: DUF2155 domain-containing protein [Rickettsiales bacterium]